MSDKYSKRRVASSSITTVISLSLVLFLLGLLGLILLSAQKVADHVKESIGFEVYLNDDAKEVDIQRLQKSLDASPFVKTSEFISKDKAREIYLKEVGDNFMPLLDNNNPLPASIDLRLKAAYANNDSILRDTVNGIKAQIMRNAIVKDFRYHEGHVDLVNTRISTVLLYFGFFIVLLMVIAIALINNTIRLAIYSKRFLIRTMLLVGATQGFIRRPFVVRGILQGIYGAIVAIALLVGMTWFFIRLIPDFLKVVDSQLFLSLFGLVVLMGIVISWASTSLAVRKYLRLKTDDLYY
ncbi:MAG TPA: permease-like cell division protein FtsX [Bacteroidia bacterium]